MDTELEEMGLISEPSGFGNEIISSAAPLVYTQEIPTTLNSDELSVYGNSLTYLSIPVLVQDTQNIISGYILNGSQIPISNRQVIVTQDNLLDITDSAQTDQTQGIKQLLNFTTDNIISNHTEDVEIDKNATDQIELSKQLEEIEAHGPVVSLDVDPPDRTGPFVCAPCNSTFSSWKLFKRHKVSHLSDKPFKCKKCPETFNYESNLQLHVATHNISNPFCPECKKSFNRVASLKSHILLHEREESLFCTECGDEFSNQVYLEEHMKEHREEALKPKKTYDCSKCDSTFNNSSALKEHTREHHKVKLIKRPKKRRRGAHVCDVCSKSFEKPSQLSRHRRIHTGEKPFKCDQCTRAFNQKGSLQIHMLKHNGLRPYSCHFCLSKFSQKGNLQAHIQRLHVVPSGDGVRVHKCDKCSCVFRKLRSLNTHVTRVHGLVIHQESLLGTVQTKEHSTDKSDNPTKDSSDKENEGNSVKGPQKLITISTLLEDGTVQKQMVQQRKVDNVRWHQCSYCSSEFKRSSDLIRHIRIHTHERPYMCKICFRSFAVLSTLTGHMRTHTGVKNYLCDVCNKAFATKGSLKFHKKSHQKDKTFPCKKCELVFKTQLECKSHMLSEHVNKNFVVKNERPNVITLESLELPEGVLLTEDGSLVEVAGVAEPETVVTEPDVTVNSERPFRCNTCHLSYKRSSHLKVHMRTHTGEKPFICSVCENSFVSNSALKLHMVTHTQVKNFSCDECGRAFSCHGSLKRHLETHAPGYSYACPVCSKLYKTQAACSKHIQSHTPPSEPLEKLRPVPLTKPKNKTLSVDENGVLSIVSESGEDKDDKQERSIQNDLTELIRSLEPGQHYTLTANEMGSLSVSTVPISSEPTPTITIQDNLTEETFPEFDDRINNQFFTNYTEVPKNSLFDQGLDGCVFLQNDQLDIGGTVLGANLAAILPPQQLHRCDLCTLAFHTSSDLAIHKATHLEPKEMEVGESLFSSVENLQDQIKDATCQLIKSSENGRISLVGLLPDDGTLYRCDRCALAFTSEEDLNAHATLHLNEKDDSCPVCHKSFSSLCELQEHIKTHGNEKNFDFDAGDKTFSTDIVLGKNLENFKLKKSPGLNKKKVRRKRSTARRLTEEETKALSAIEPNTASLSERVLLQSILEKDRINMPVKDEEKSVVEVHANKCKYCPKSFRKPSDLVRHLRIHTGERPYQCSRCNKSFTVKSTASCHMKTHTKDKSYKCHICFKMFATTGSLKVHMRLHTGSKPFTCPYCDARFRTSGHKKAHLASHINPLTQQYSTKTKPWSKEPQKNDAQSADASETSTLVTDDCLGFTPLLQKNQTQSESLDESGSANPQYVFSVSNNLNQQLGMILNGKLIPDSQYVVRNFPEETDMDVGLPGSAHIVVTFNEQNGTEVEDSSQVALSADNIMAEALAIPKMDISSPQVGNGPGEPKVTPKKRRNKTANESQRNKFSCKVCKKSFAKEATYEKHMKKHQGEECIVCSEKFERKNDLEVHMLVHALEQEWQCPNCNIQFVDEEAFRTHKCTAEEKAALRALPEAPTLDLGSVVNDLFFSKCSLSLFPFSQKTEPF